MNCDKCGKPSTNLLLSPLQNGPNGYRRYKLCQKCRGGVGKVVVEPAKEATGDSTVVVKIESVEDTTK